MWGYGVPGWRQDDHSRLEQLRAHTARSGHIYRNFSWCDKHLTKEGQFP